MGTASPPSPPSSSSTTTSSSPDKWSSRAGPASSSSSSREPTSQSLKWFRPDSRSPSSQRASASKSAAFERELAPHQSPASPLSSASRGRDAAPHQGGPRLSRSGVLPLSQILRKDRVNSALQATEEQQEGDDLENVEELQERAVEATLAAEVGPVEEDIPDEEPGVRTRTRSGKLERRDFKERGSIVARLGDGNVAIPKHPRVSNKTTMSQSAKEKEKKKKAAAAIKRVNLDIFIPSMVSVGNLAKLLNVRLENLRRMMIRVGMDEQASYDHMLTSEYASLIAMEYGRNPIINDEAAFDIYPAPAPSDRSTLPLRPPVVTIMGHVDHGKTTLLDTLRSTSVAKGEAGGITQHIGAFSVPVPASGSGDVRTITFLDTPGHAAFSAMRARGAGVTDIVVLVVAADDGIMPQTREVIQLIQKDKVGVIVAINKVDKPGVDVSKVEHALLAEGVQLETFGGDIPSVHVSGLTGQGLDQLVETISALAEMQDLRTERDGKVQGYVLESKVQKGLGPVATVLILRGCMKSSDHIIGGLSHAKVRVLTDSNGKAVKAAYPGMAVTVSGWKELPKAGDEILQGTEAEVKKALANRIRKTEMEATLGDMEAINEQRRLEREQKEQEAEAPTEQTENPGASAAQKEEAGLKELRLVVKADVSGSVEAVAGALEGIGNNVARVKIVATGVGDVTESDVMRAKAIDGAVVAFSVGIPRAVQTVAASEQVPLLSSTIIYRLMDDVKNRVIALLPVIIEKRVTGEASVLQLFDIHLKGKKIMKVAGCRVTNGLVEKAKLARVVRNGEIVHEGRLETLKHLKKDITEASKGMECGMGFEHYDDLREGDMIQMYQEVEKPGNL